MSDAPISPEAIDRDPAVALAAARPAPADDFPCCSPGSTAHEPREWTVEDELRFGRLA